MVRIIEFVQCDCEQGKLEHIASTRAEGSVYSSEKGECGTFRATHFYGCNNCNAIYTNYSGTHIITESDIILNRVREYKGSLTREELKQYTLKCKGRITKEDAERIIAMRKK